jgi:hypothetical protein
MSGGREKYMDITASKGMMRNFIIHILHDIIVLLTSRMIRWMGHVGQLQEIRNS